MLSEEEHHPEGEEMLAEAKKILEAWVHLPSILKILAEAALKGESLLDQRIL